MPDAILDLSPDLTKNVGVLARALTAAARIRALYPREHPAVGSALYRLAAAAEAATAGGVLALAVTPDALLIEGVPVAPGEPATAELASVLHGRDIVQLTLTSDVPRPALDSLISLLSQDPATLRGQGGPAAVWAPQGHLSITIEQIDYRKVLADRETARPANRDDLWRSIVQSFVNDQKTFSEEAIQRLLQIAGDPAEIGELASAVIAPKCAPDGSPMLTTQAAVLLGTFRHMAALMSVASPDRVAEMMRNLAIASLRLDTHLILEVLRSDDAAAGGVQVVRGLASAFEDGELACLVASALSTDQQASARLAAVFDALAPEAERKERVLSATRSLLRQTDFGRSRGFETAWRSIQELLLSYNEKPFVSDQYRSVLDGALDRGVAAAGGAPPPEELGEWLESVSQESVRNMSTGLLLDLLALDRDGSEAGELVAEIAAAAEDLLLSGAYPEAADLARALADAGSSPVEEVRVTVRRALEQLGLSPSFREAIALLDDLAPAEFQALEAFCKAVGASTVESLRVTLTLEDDTLARRRAAELILAFGGAAVSRLTPLIGDDRWWVQRNAAALLGGIGVPDAIPLLQPFLRKSDPRVSAAALGALARIDDPAAARAVHVALRAATGETRLAVADVLVAERDPRVVPLLARILEESEPFGADHPLVIDVLAALGALGDEGGVAPAAAIMTRRSWIARRKARAVKRSAVEVLVRIGTPAASAELANAARHGDRMLRKVIAEARARHGRPAEDG